MSTTEKEIISSANPSSISGCSTNDLMALTGESSGKPIEDLMDLAGEPSGKPIDDLMAPAESPSLEYESIEEHITFLKSHPLENLSNYALLGLKKGASEEEIKKRYRELVYLVHPDKGGDPSIFQAITKAYESLVEKSTITPHQEEDESNVEDEKEFLDSFGSTEIFPFAVKDYLTDPKYMQVSVYQERPYDPDKNYEERGRALIEQNYAPYMSPEKFLDLHPKTQKEFSILLAKQEEAYKALRTNSNHTSLNNLTQDDIYDSIDLDSPHLEEVRGQIIGYCQQGRLSEQSLNFLSMHILNANSIAAITTDVVASEPTETVELDFTETSNLDVSELYLRGWLLIHGEEGVTSGALKLFLSYSRSSRTQLATAVGHYQAEYPGHNLMSIFDHYGIANKEKREAAFNDCINIDPKSFFLTYRKKYPNITIEECEMELTKRSYKLCHSEIMETFVQDLKKVSVPKDDKDWYQLGIKSIEKSQGPLTKNAFGFLCPQNQRYVAIQWGKKSNDFPCDLGFLDTIIYWANNQESAEKDGLEEIKAGRAFITLSEFLCLTEEKKRSVAIKVGGELSLVYDPTAIEPTYEKVEECTEKSEEKSELLEERGLSNTPPNTASNVSTQHSFFRERSPSELLTESRPSKRPRMDLGLD